MNEAYYDYYRFESDTLKPKYDKEIGEPRREIIRKMLDESGATAYTSSSDWGGAEIIRELVYPFDTALKNEPHIKVVRTDYFEDAKIVVLDGKRNRKAGNEFNKPVNDANKALKDLPDFKAWVIKHFNIKRTGIGEAHPNGRGMSMISTDFAMRGNTYFFRIPNDKADGRSEAVTIPDGFEKLTYGQFYDLIQQEND